MTRESYIAPEIKVCKIESESIMAALSMGISDDPAHGGGSAKPYTYSNEKPEANGGGSPLSGNNSWEE